MAVKTQYRVIILMLSLLVVAGIGLFVLSQSEKSHTTQLYQEIVDERSRLFNAVYRLNGQPQASIANDYTYWDEMVSYVRRPTKQFASDNLDTALSTYQVDAIWVLRPNGSQVYGTTSADLPKLELPMSSDDLIQAFEKSRLLHFFVRSDQGIIEIRGATIHPSSDSKRLTKPQGYFLVGRLYGQAFRQRLGGDLKSSVSLTGANEPVNAPEASSGQVLISKELTDINNQPIARMVVSSDAPSIRQLYAQSTQRLQNFVVIVVPLLLVLFWFLTRYVTDPLNKISATLKSKDTKNLGDLPNKQTEFGQIAALLGEYFQQNREQLQAAHARLRASINSINIGFIMTDADRKIIMVNDAARRILFNDVHRAKEVTMAELSQLLPNVKLEQTIESSMTTTASHGLGDVTFGDKFLRLYVAPITEKPGKTPVLGCIALFEDVTLEKSLNRARDEFFSIASHELRTPLTVIMGNAAMIRDHIVPGAKSKELEGMSTDIYDSSERLIQMVNDFLDTSRLEQDKIKFDLVPVDVKKLLQALVKEYRKMVEQQGLKLKLEVLDGHGPIIVRADQDKLQQVLINLVSNAVTFTSSGSITLRLESHPDYARIFVTDTGEGIPKERQHLLFRKFQQAEENILSRNASKSVLAGSARDTTHGTGLGLYISKMLMEGMGGLIRLESSEPGKGTSFSVTLPMAKTGKIKKGGPRA